jgi:23S rRNA (uracil1939-C5)-methyltransferase
MNFKKLAHKGCSPEFFTSDIYSLSHDGRGIATINGITTFVEGALPNEKVICQIFKKHRHYQEAKIHEILQPSPERTLPKCPHFNNCGGCSLQHLHPAFQIQYKQQILLEQLKRFGKVVPYEILPPLTGKTSAYRRRARLGVQWIKNSGKAFIGFREKTSHQLASLESCYILDPNIGPHLKELSLLVSSLTQGEHIFQIEIAIGDRETALVFSHRIELTLDDKQKIIIFAKKYHFSIYLHCKSISKLYPPETPELLSYALPNYQLEIFFHPTDFVQINSEMNALLINQTMTLLAPGPEDIILELFCGLGNFTLPLARFAKHVTGIEGVAAMVKRAKDNAEKNHLYNVDFYTANLMAVKTAPWLQKKYNKILLDPPRTGAKEIIPHLAKLSATHILYISCNPATLARDAGELHKLKYKLKKVGVINMFPHTSHIEAIALFER